MALITAVIVLVWMLLLGTVYGGDGLTCHGGRWSSS